MSSRLTALVPLALFAAVFAGCSSGGGGDDANVIDSEAARVLALVEGQRWNDDADLLVLGTVESHQDAKEFLADAEEGEEGGEFASSASKYFLEEFLPDADDDVGDGNAGTWFALFSAPGETMQFVVAVTYDGDTTGREIVPEDEDMDFGPILEYEIDSTSAVARASKKGGSEFIAAMNAPDGGVFYALVGPMEGYESMMDQGAWIVIAASQSEDKFVMIFVDAETGHAMDMQDLMAMAFAAGGS